MNQFIDHPLRLLSPKFESPLLDVINDLEYLRRHGVMGTTPSAVFIQLKNVFHILESLASARIEGNHTTLSDYVESKFLEQNHLGEQFAEISNIEKAMQQIEEIVAVGEPISEHLLRSLHAITVDGLFREGDPNPGAYRQGAVKIAQAKHTPTDALLVKDYMTELVEFINRDDAPKYGLMKVALSHHRFVWIHPFSNGNGRVVRLMTYALLIKYGFRVNAAGRLLNPATIFCADRNQYYSHLAQADRGTYQSLENWCVYVLSGMRNELMKIDNLADYEFLKTKILLPAISYALDRKFITLKDYSVLSTTIKAGIVKSGDLEVSMPELNVNQRTYQIRKLLESGMLQPMKAGARQYTLGFNNNMLLRGVIHALTEQGFIPEALAKA